MIPASEFARRRRQLMRMAGPDAALIAAAAPERLRNADNFHPYRQDSDFHYLSGFPEPDAVLLLLPGRPQGEAIMFCRQRDPAQERWDGARVGSDGAVADYGMDDAFPIDDIDDIAPGMIEGRSRLYCHFGREPDFDARLLTWLRRLRGARGGGVVPKEFVALGYLLHDLRLYKSRNELRLMRRAAAVAVEAHRAALALARPGTSEFQVEAEVLKTIRAHGAVPSYPAMVAGGANACVMHYRANSATLGRGDLLMLDAGAEVDCYASDITRTFPVGGRYSKAQRALYDVVQAAQAAAIDEARPGRPFSAAHEAAVRVVADGLCALGIIAGDAAAAVESGACERYFPHKTCHWLGMDVHDVGDYRIDGEPRMLEPGMVMAVEPGIYIPADDRDVAPRWRGLGIRIEDDVAVTRESPEVLTAAMPTAAAEIEKLLASR
ncbi:MAG TPA: aminopeptidase P N-terminal domain-containing protein [Rhodanobacteraceae bacterium]|nr:aminopeptidase P N-terminal domain-containing protein [Rhodanobacteraceae bacterium]